METSIFPEFVLNIFNQPARIIIAGYSNSGKSEMCKKIIEIYHENFNHILYCGVESHSLQSNKEINPKLTVTTDILNPFDFYLSWKYIIYFRRLILRGS